jgi:hypothetical protein
MREAVREDLVLLRHQAEEQMDHSQYRHFLSRAREGLGDRNHIGCFTDQVKLTHALVRDLDEAIKEVKLLGEYEEELSKKITKLEALCKRLWEDAEKLREEKMSCPFLCQNQVLIVCMTQDQLFHTYN